MLSRARKHWFKAVQVSVPIGAALAGGVLTVLGIRKAVRAKEDVRTRTLNGEFDEDWKKFKDSWPEKDRAKLDTVRAEYMQSLRDGTLSGSGAQAPSGSFVNRIVSWGEFAAQQKRLDEEKARKDTNAAVVEISKT